MFRFFLAATAVALSFSHSEINAAVVGDTVSLTNTFQSGAFTGGTETFFVPGTANVSSPALEFIAFAGIFDINVEENQATLTFANADPTSLLVNQYGATDADRYYFGFGANVVDSAMLTSSSMNAGGLIAGLDIQLIAPGSTLNLPTFDPANPTFTRTFTNGGFRVELGENTDYLNATVGDSFTIGFATTAVPEPSSAALMLGIGGLASLRRRRRKPRS